MLKQAQVRSAAQEILTHGDKGSEVRDCLGIEMVGLSPKEIQKSMEKGMWRQRKTMVDMSSKEDAFALLRLRFGLVPRKPPGAMINQPTLGQILQVV